MKYCTHMCPSELTCSDDDYQTVQQGLKGKLKRPYIILFRVTLCTLKTEHWRYNNNALAGAKRRLVNMAVGYHSEQEGHMCLLFKGEKDLLFSSL